MRKENLSIKSLLVKISHKSSMKFSENFIWNHALQRQLLTCFLNKKCETRPLELALPIWIHSRWLRKRSEYQSITIIMVNVSEPLQYYSVEYFLISLHQNIFILILQYIIVIHEMHGITDVFIFRKMVLCFHWHHVKHTYSAISQTYNILICYSPS